MHSLSEQNVFIFIAQLGIIVLFARIFGEIAKKLGQPILIGEVFAGLILGPTIFGKISPLWFNFLFPAEGPDPIILQGMSWLCVLFLLLITGLEIDLRASLREGKNCLTISIFGLILPFVGTFLAANYLPDIFFDANVSRILTNLLLSLSLSVVAIPVIAKILMDLKILRSDVGVNIITAGIFSDIIGWSILAILIAIISGNNITFVSVIKPIIIMILYLTLTLTIGKRTVDKIFRWIGYNKLDQTALISTLFSLTLINGAIAHMLGIHVIFGAFITGIMAGESEKITEYMKTWIQDFVFAIFAPIFFVLIGMQLKLSNFNLLIPIISIAVITSALKILGSFIGGLISGMGRKNSLSIAIGLNTPGTMGIIIALIGFEYKIFNEQMFSSIVLISIITSIMIGPLLKWSMKHVRRPLAKYFQPEHIFLDVPGSSKKKVIANISNLMFERKIINDPKYIYNEIWRREKIMPTAIGEGVALPHARLKNIKTPILCFFRLITPIDFESPDNQPVNLLFLELTNSNDDGMQLNLITQIAKIVSDKETRLKLTESKRPYEIHNILTFDRKL